MVLACAGCYAPIIVLALGIALDALAGSRVARDAFRFASALRRGEPSARATGARGAHGPTGACLLHNFIDDDALCALLAHLDARSLEAVATCDRRCQRLARDEGVWRAVVARTFGGADARLSILAHLPRGLLAAAPAGRAPLAALRTALASLRPSPCWWRGSELARSGGCGGGEAAHGLPPGLDPQLCEAAAAVCALAQDACAPRGCEWRLFYYLLQATWRRLVVASHDSAADCWMVVGTHVCDVTRFLTQHPGEAGPLLLFGGLDATAAFDATGHSFAAYYFETLDVPGLQMAAEGRPADVERAWASAGAGGARLEAASAVGGWEGTPDAPDASGSPSVRRAPSLSALATLGWSFVPQVAFMPMAWAGAWGDEPAGRELSYHDFLQLRGTTAQRIEAAL